MVYGPIYDGTPLQVSMVPKNDKVRPVMQHRFARLGLGALGMEQVASSISGSVGYTV